MENKSLQKILFAQKSYPVFQNRMYESAAEAIECPKGNIRLVEDLVTGLVYNMDFDPDLMVYDEYYQNEQAESVAFKSHLEHVYEIIERLIGASRLLEVGCGKGYFLEMLEKRGCDVTGCDPVYEGVNPRIQKKPFSNDVIRNSAGIILRHVLEHVQNPLLFLNKLKEANSGEGKIYIEVPCFDWICRKNAWFDIFYEHVNYFRLTDFNRMFGTVFESGCLFQGQYIYVVADIDSFRMPSISNDDRVAFPEEMSKFSGASENIKSNEVVVWGGASKGVIFSLMRERANQSVDYVVDINPAKQGKYLPATGLRVSSPEEVIPGLSDSAVIYVMNSNYMDEIKNMSSHAFNYIGIDNE